MTATRLDSIAPQLAKKLHLATTQTQRATALAACDYGIRNAQVDAPVILILESLRQNGTLSKEQISELNSIVCLLDQEYFQASEKGDNEGAIRLFSQARAVSAIAAAAMDNSYEAAIESIYEASTTTDEATELIALITQIIDRNQQSKTTPI